MSNTSYEVPFDVAAAWEAVGFSPSLPDEEGLVDIFPPDPEDGDTAGLLEDSMFLPRIIRPGSYLGDVATFDWADTLVKEAVFKRTLGTQKGPLFPSYVVHLAPLWALRENTEATFAASITTEPNWGEWKIAVHDKRSVSKLEELTDAISIENMDKWPPGSAISALGHMAIGAVDMFKGNVTIASDGGGVRIEPDWDKPLGRKVSPLNTAIAGTIAMARIPRIG